MHKIFYTSDRKEWRKWLETHFEKETEVWFVFPMKESGEASLSYNDAVEEALCFGWIDSTIKHIDTLHRAQRFTPRKGDMGHNSPQMLTKIYAAILDEDRRMNAAVMEERFYGDSKDIKYPKDV